MKVITVGRSSENDIVIDDTKVSRHHLQIIQDDYGNFRLLDFGSANGTFVNGQKISGEIALSRNDIVRIGNTTLPWKNYFPTQKMSSVYSPPPPPIVSQPSKIEHVNINKSADGFGGKFAEGAGGCAGNVVGCFVGIIIVLILIALLAQTCH